MRTEELEMYMLKDPYIRRFYGGVVARNEIPLVFTKPSIFIVNTDPTNLPGKHWFVLFYNTNSVNEQFNSTGQPPQVDIQAQLVRNGMKYMYNNKRVQSFTSSTCGEFALFYSYFRCRGFTFQEILDMFTSDLENNETIVNMFYVFTK